MKPATKFLDFCIQCEKEAILAGRKGAAVNYRKTRSKLDTYTPVDKLRLSAINEDWVKAFNDWLVSMNHEKTTISFYNRTIRSIYNQAVKKQLIKNAHPFDRAYTKVAIVHYPISFDEESERVPFEELSHEDLVKCYKTLAYKYNNILRKLKEIM